MQIKTGITLAVGVGIGIFVGMGVSEDAKERLAKHIRDRLTYMLTGEEQKPSKSIDYEAFRAKYANYRKPDDDWESCLRFETEEDAWGFANMICKKAYDNPLHTVSVHEVCIERGKLMDWTWDKYGWTKDEIKEDWCVVLDRKSEYKIKVPKPHAI